MDENKGGSWNIDKTRRIASGTVLQPIEVNQHDLAELITLSLTNEHDRVVWFEGDDEVVVDFTRTRVGVRTGLVAVAVTLFADDLGAGELTVPLAVGSPDGITGLLAVTPRAPEGPATLALRWGEPVIAAVWGALLDVVTEIAAAAGEDANGAPLDPSAFLADAATFGIVLQARPTIESLEASGRRTVKHHTTGAGMPNCTGPEQPNDEIY